MILSPNNSVAVDAPDSVRRREIGLERRERTRQKLLGAAAKVIAELGENRSTIEDFVQAAGVARGTFYNHYATRTELLEDLWAYIGRDPFTGIHLACNQLSDPAERLATETRMVLHSAAKNSAWGWLVFSLSADRDSVNDELLLYPRPHLLDGLRTRRFAFDDLAGATDLVVGAVRSALKATLREGRSDNYASNICVLLLQALGVPSSEARAIAALPLPQVRTPE